MTTKYDVRYAVHPEDYAGYDTQLLRENFLVSEIFTPDEIRLTYTFYDRFVVGGAMPVKKALPLETIDEFKAAYFLERRELGVINVGGKGKVSVDGKAHELDYKEALYVGRGAKKVEFASVDAGKPAKFYLNSTPAHAAYPTKKVGQQDAEVMELGALETSNQRTIRKLLVSSVVQTCQLQMGMTELKPGSVWNTMPPHTHSRRMEVYFYFAVPEKQAVCHFMGPPDETRHLWVLNEQAVVSPPWSMHCGAGTSNYIFIWGMAGENLDYDDMDKHTPDQLGAR
ncbi:MAG TPA: 5-dehydro-4-deoxy-D-glucuronate isomerase [Gammaproteobacteria bacterium]|nr:5-dehydro-4-deoxy-D-glucuronate isomerase [Gammaproteobacteria bacterium]